MTRNRNGRRPAGGDLTARDKGQAALAAAGAAASSRAGEKLARGEGLLRAATDGLSVFVGVLTPDGTLVEANSAALRAAGLRHEDVIGLPFEETYWWSFSPESRARLRAAVERARRGELSRFDAPNRVAEGRLVTVDFMLAPVLDSAGRVSHLIASGVDVTERKQAEEAMRETETKERQRAEELQRILDAVPAGVWIAHDPLCRRITGNRASYEMLRLPEGANQSPSAPPDERPANFRVLRPDGREYAPEELPQQRAAATGLPQRDVRLDLAFDDGLRRNIYGNAEPLFDAEGKPRGAVSAFVDITELVRAEAQIRRQAALLDIAPDAIVVRDMSDRVLYWNKGAERLYGWSAREVAGRNVAELLYREPTPQFREAQAVLAERGEWRGELHQVTKDGRDIIVEGRWTLVHDEEGRAVAKLVVNTDITERKMLEKELLRATQLSLVGELAAGLAHEIKNPLAGLKGAVDILIQRHRGGGLEVEVLEDIRHSVERVDQTVRVLLERARPRPLRREPASLAEAAHRAVQLARHHAESLSSQGRRVSVSFEPPRSPAVASVDAAQIEGAIFNLVINGIEAIEGDGSVAVRVSVETGADGGPAEAVVEVEDSGRGIAEGELDRVFQPFHTTTKGGTGLGLPSVRRIILAHGGRVEVSSTPGRGSTFRLRLSLTAQA